MSGTICGVIAAAGRSSRMGSFKPLLPYEDSTVIRSCAVHLRSAGVTELVVVVGYRGGEIQEALSGLDVRIVENPDYDSGQMFDSLRLGMEALHQPCEKLLLTPGDVPWVSPALIGALLKSEAEFACPVYMGKRGHPAAISGARIPALCADDGEGGLRGAVERLGFSTALVETDEIGVTIDLDTPADYERLLELKHG